MMKYIKKRVWFSGKMRLFQSRVGSSILPTRKTQKYRVFALYFCCLCEKEQANCLACVENRKAERCFSRSGKPRAGVANPPLAEFVTDSLHPHHIGKVKAFWFASRSLPRTKLVLVRGSATILY